MRQGRPRPPKTRWGKWPAPHRHYPRGGVRHEVWLDSGGSTPLPVPSSPLWQRAADHCGARGTAVVPAKRFTGRRSLCPPRGQSRASPAATRQSFGVPRGRSRDGGGSVGRSQRGVTPPRATPPKARACEPRQRRSPQPPPPPRMQLVALPVVGEWRCHRAMEPRHRQAGNGNAVGEPRRRSPSAPGILSGPSAKRSPTRCRPAEADGMRTSVL